MTVECKQSVQLADVGISVVHNISNYISEFITHLNSGFSQRTLGFVPCIVGNKKCHNYKTSVGNAVPLVVRKVNKL